MEISLPEKVLYILDKLEACGYSADVVGGPVRDYMLGKIPSDFDITTSARPEQTKAVFSDKRTVDTGIKHGTVTLVLDGEPFEITTYRIDGEYKDSRHPDSVSFTSDIALDLSRRDFTVNAMAYSPRRGITDPHGGRDDLRAEILRAVGDPALRFSEDALRIMRCVRFSATLGFSVEEKTREAIFEKMHLVSDVSRERIFTEWRKLLAGKNAYSVLENYRPLLEYVIPNIVGYALPKRHPFDKADPISRLLSLYTNSADPASAFFDSAKQLKTDSHLRDLGRETLTAISDITLRDERDALRLLMNHGEEVARASVRLGILLGKLPDGCEELLDLSVSSGKPYRLSDLAIRGDELCALGARGKRIGETLSTLLLAVISDECENEHDALLTLARKII